MSYSIAHLMAETAREKLMEQEMAAGSFPYKCRAHHPGIAAEITREDALARLTECAQRATEVWHASVIFISPPLAGSVHELDRVRIMYRVIMQHIAHHMLAVGQH